MKKSILSVVLFLAIGLTGQVFAQTAAQYIEAGNQSYGAKDYAKAVQYYQAAAQIDPNSAAAYQGLGNSQYLLGQNSDALASYQKALALSPGNTQLAQFVESLKAKVGSAPAVAAPAAAAPAAAGSAKNFEIDVMGGVAVGSSGFDLGFGGGAAGYLLMPGGLGIGGSVGYYMFNQTTSLNLGPIGSASLSNDWTNIEILASAKYSFEGQGIKPYLKAGAGLDMFSLSGKYTITLNPPYDAPPYSTYYNNLYTSIPAATSMYPMIQVGGGAMFSMGPDMSLFVEAKYNLIIGNGGTTSYIPINAGLAFDM